MFGKKSSMMPPATPMKKNGGFRSFEYDESSYASTADWREDSVEVTDSPEFKRPAPVRKARAVMPPPTPVKRFRPEGSRITDAETSKRLSNNLFGTVSEARIKEVSNPIWSTPITPIVGLTKEQKMFEAVKHDDVEALNEVIAAGVDLNAKDSDGNTPLVKAAFSCKWNVFCCLIGLEEVDVDAQNRFKGTALHYVAMNNNLNAAIALISRNANPLLEDVHSKTALYHADVYANEDLDEAIYFHQRDYIIKTDNGLLGKFNGQFDKNSKNFIRNANSL